MSIHGIQKPQIDQSFVQPASQDITTAKPKERKKQGKKQNPNLSQARVKELFNYNPNTGIFTRRSDNTNPVTKDKRGYNRISIDKSIYAAGIIAWLYNYGCRPKSRLVYIDGNLSNLSLDNLKPYTNKPKSCRKEVTTEVLNKLFSYDEVTGILYRKVKAKSSNGSIKCKAGSEVGYKNKSGYIVINIGRSNYLAHRIIWCMVHGYWPENGIDHINRQRDCNILSNLREISQQCNSRNIPIQINNSTGVAGVTEAYIARKSKKVCYSAFIKVDYVKIGLGHHTDFTEAVAHRLAAEQALDWSGCDSNSSAYQYMQAYVRGEDMQTYLKDLANK